MKMKWGRKKSPPSSMITRVFPASWFSKFKHKGAELATNSAMQNSALPVRWKEARFHSVDNGAYWSLSFRKERIESSLYDDEFEVPVSSFKSFGFREMEMPRREGFRSFNEMVFDKTKMKEKQHGDNILIDNGVFRRKKPNGEDELTTLRKKDVNDRRSRKLSRRVVRKKAAEMEKGPDDEEEERLKPADILPMEPETMDQMKDFGEAFNSRNRNNTNTEWKSAYKTRKAHSRKMKQNQAKACFAKPECRIRVLEDMKKARVKLKKAAKKDRVVEAGTIYDSFAMVKSSFNPQQDFRDSMVEMISEKGIRRPEELEELLACYLTLNCDRYHDLIIKIFQQVWFEMNSILILKQKSQSTDDSKFV